MARVTRRAILGASAALAARSSAAPQSQGSSQPPNILLVISDQFRADNLGCMGMNPMGMTPNLDGLARRGVLFRSAVVNHPVCAPARASLFTGQYEEKHGVWHNGPGLEANATTLATVLRGRGYSANYIGKWHLSPATADTNPGPVAPEHRGGFLDVWEAANTLEHTSHAYEGSLFDGAGKPIPFSGVYRDEFLTGRGVEFLGARAKPPFLLVMSYLNTHHQNDSDLYVPPKELAGKYRDFFVPQDLRPLPGSWPSQLSDYYGCVTSIDNAVGTLTSALKQQGFLDNTIVVFISDHSCHFKTRNSEYKRSPHESSIHIPLIMAGPRFNRSAEVRELVSQVDVAPTLLEACGAPVPQSMQGRSFLPLVEGRHEGWRDEVYIHMSEFMTGRVLRTPQWTYAVAAPKRPGWRAVPEADLYVEYMLYDNFADPWQHTNLAGRTETAEVSKALRARLLERIAEAGGKQPAIEPGWFPYS
jgi:arylsulfatase A-like enzyme